MRIIFLKGKSNRGKTETLHKLKKSSGCAEQFSLVSYLQLTWFESHTHNNIGKIKKIKTHKSPLTMKKLTYIFAIFVILVATSCSKDDDNPVSPSNEQQTENQQPDDNSVTPEPIVDDGFVSAENLADSISKLTAGSYELKVKGELTQEIVNATGDALRKLDSKTSKAATELVLKISIDFSATTGLTKLEGSKSDDGSTYTGLAGCKILISVILPEALTEIGEYAMADCINLQEVVFPTSIAAIGSNAFLGCENANLNIAGKPTPDGYIDASKLAETLSKLGDGEHTIKVSGILTPEMLSVAGDSLRAKNIENYYTPNPNLLINLDLSETQGLTKIADGTFSHCALSTIILPESVTSIGEPEKHIGSVGMSPFGGSNLTSITIPKSVKEIGHHAFSGTKLTSIYIPSTVTKLYAQGKGIHIESDSYIYDNNILYNKDKTILIDGTRASGDITIPEGVIEIFPYAFYQDYDLKSITLPSTLTSIGHWAFEHCGLGSITLPESIKNIGATAFCNNYELTSVIIDGVPSIDRGAFLGCGITSFNIPEGVTLIPGLMFFNCKYLNSVIIPESVTTIGECAFVDCRSLTSVTIPQNVTSISRSIFNDCTSLTNVTFECSTPPSLVDWIGYDGTIYVPASAVEAYKTADVWKEHAEQIVGY